MTKKQFIKKVKELHKQTNKTLLEKAEKILKSGCIDLNNFKNDYVLPKIFITAFYNKMSFQYRPFDVLAKREVKNLQYFI
jgi:hypothetical protein